MTASPSYAESADAILHVLWHMDTGGAERAVYQLVREQRRRGVEADILLASKGGFYAELARKSGARVFELGQRRTFDISVGAEAEAISASYPIVHFHYPEIGLIHLVARRSSARLYYTHRAGVFSYRPRQLARYKLAGFYFRRRFTRISANTRQAAAAASRLFGISPSLIDLTYNGLDFELLAPRRSKREVLEAHNLSSHTGDFYVGTSANLRNWKRVDRLLLSVARLRDEKLTCFVIGDGPARAKLEGLARELGIENRVVFTGQRKHVGDYLQLLDVFVLPSGPQESFGNAAVEAMGMAVPAIVFADGGGLTEHVTDGSTGYVVETTEQLSNRLKMLAASPILRHKLGEAAREHVRGQYGLDSMIERYGALYDSSREGSSR